MEVFFCNILMINTVFINIVKREFYEPGLKIVLFRLGTHIYGPLPVQESSFFVSVSQNKLLLKIKG